MTDTMRQIVQRTIGDAAEVAEIDEVPIPRPGPGELLVMLEAAPINPAEILMFEGRYGYGPTRPALPRKAGIEGVGTVVGGATDLVPSGTPVALVGADGLWSDYMLISAGDAICFPAGVDLQQAAMAMVNPQAAITLLEDYSAETSGRWVIQNAANSGFGRSLDAAASRRHLDVINVVRSEVAARSISGSAHGPVLVDGPRLTDRVRDLTGGGLPWLAVDAIGGKATNRIAHTLGPGGTVAVFGLLSGQPCQVDLDLIVFNDVKVSGYWMPRTMQHRSQQEREGALEEALKMLADGGLQFPVDGSYPLSDVANAIRHATRKGHHGKILLTR